MKDTTINYCQCLHNKIHEKKVLIRPKKLEENLNETSGDELVCQQTKKKVEGFVGAD